MLPELIYPSKGNKQSHKEKKTADPHEVIARLQPFQDLLSAHLAALVKIKPRHLKFSGSLKGEVRVRQAGELDRVLIRFVGAFKSEGFLYFSCPHFS